MPRISRLAPSLNLQGDIGKPVHGSCETRQDGVHQGSAIGPSPDHSATTCRRSPVCEKGEVCPWGARTQSAGLQVWLCCPGNHLRPSQSMSPSKEVRGGRFLLGGFPFSCCWQRGEGSGQGKGGEPEQGKTLQEVVCSLGVEGKKDLSQGRKGKWVVHARAGETVFGLES